VKTNWSDVLQTLEAEAEVRQGEPDPLAGFFP